jgi:hypothetical protein
MNSAM